MFFVTNGTSTSNKMVYQALCAPGDIVVVDRNCHKSHHYGMVLAGAQPYYVEAFPLVAYSMYGAVPIRSIKKALLDLKAAGRLDRVRMVALTNVTFDGHMYDTHRVMEECLAIKPDLIFLWDEAWFGFARWSWLYRPRTAMGARARCRRSSRDPAYLAALPRAGEDPRRGPRPEGQAPARHAAAPRPAQGEAARLPVELDAQVHVGAAPGLDGAGRRRGVRTPRAAFKEAVFTHASTSPNLQIIASLDLARRQMELEGYELVTRAIALAVELRAARQHPPAGLEVLPHPDPRRHDPGGVPQSPASRTTSRPA